ncbi:MAG TPA: TolC family protein [Bacteroidetes bacterium]|nr:TolC family protein [Bacteroidota bacterium]
MSIFRSIFPAILLCIATSLPAQTPLSLEQCLEIAVASNLQVRQSGNSVSIEKINLIRRKFDFLPGLSSSISGSKNFGRTVDNFTQAIAQSPVTLNMNLGASLTIFRGFSKWNELRKAENSVKAAVYSLEDLKNDVRLNVALAFFQTIFARDNRAIAQNNRDLLARQVKRNQELVKAGKRTEGDLYGIEAEFATAKASLVTAQNSFESARLNLLLSLDLDPRENFELVRPDLERLVLGTEVRSPEAIFDYARQNNPAMREQEMRLLASKFAMQSARSVYFPTLSLNYGAYSFYSSNARPLDSLRFVQGELHQFFGPTTPFNNQFSNNLSHGISLSLNIPIFSNWAFRQTYNNAQINYDNSILQYQSQKNELLRDVMQAWQDATAAQSQFSANQEKLISLQKSYEYAEKKYEVGLLDFYTLKEILNQKIRAELELNQAKYDYVLKRKVLDLYEGKEMRF